MEPAFDTVSGVGLSDPTQSLAPMCFCASVV